MNILFKGINNLGGVMSTIIKRNSTIPSTEKSCYYTVVDNQTQMLIKVENAFKEVLLFSSIVDIFIFMRFSKVNNC
jgi:molecular chaperone DnaK (HSP70)